MKDCPGSKQMNPYQKIVLNKVYKDETDTVKIENWSILSDNVKYVQHDRESKTVHGLDVETLDYRHHKKLYNKLKGEERQTLDMHFGDSSHVLKPHCLDLYEGVHSDVVYLNRFDECSDLSTTYLGKRDMTRHGYE